MPKRKIFRMAAAALLLSAVAAVETPAHAAEPAVSDTAEARTEHDALAVAKRHGHPVAVTGLRTEFNETVANPDGTFTLTASATPKRVRRGDGFVPLDTTLRANPDGSFSPAAALSELRLSGGGAGPLVTLTTPGERKGLSLTAPWALPAPRIAGATATYPDVLAGVDLQMIATVDGYQQLLVVRNATAARNPALARIAWGVKGLGGATVRENGGTVQVVDAKGEVVFGSDTPAMWDSGADTATRKERPIAIAAGDGALTVQPDLSMLVAPDVTFPVYIDPALSPASPGDWTMVNSGAPNTAHYNYNSRAHMRAGVEYGTTKKWRTHMKFTISSMAGGTVYSAGLAVEAYHTNLCAGSDVELWRAQAVADYKTYTWYNDSDNDLIARIDTQHFSANKGDCPKPNDPGKFAGTLLAEVKTQVANSSAIMTFALKGQTESNDSDWTKFVPGATALQVTYDHTPGTPTGLGISKTATCPDAAYPTGSAIAATTPVLCAKPQDQNGGTARVVEFEVWDTAHTTRIAFSNGTVTARTNNQTAPWTVTPALAQGDYDWRVSSCDEHTCGAWSAWWRFTVDTSPPVIPGAGSAAYPAKSTGTWSGGVGVAGDFTFTSTADASAIEVELNGVSQGWKTTTSGVWTGPVAPNRDGVNSVRARARDAAGNTLGWSAAYEFLVTPAANKSWRWELNGALKSVDTVASTVTDPGAYPLSGFTPSYVAGPATNAVPFNGAQALAVSGPVVDTRKSFTVSARVKLTGTPAGPVTVASQDGPTGSGFRLQYRTDVDLDGGGNDAVWCFTMFASDTTADTADSRSCAFAWQGTGVWVNIAGVYDAVNHQVQMWAQDDTGAMVMWEPPTSFTCTWSAGGVFAVGRARQGGAAAQYLTGQVDRVAVYAKALSAAEINADKAFA